MPRIRRSTTSRQEAPARCPTKQRKRQVSPAATAPRAPAPSDRPAPLPALPWAQQFLPEYFSDEPCHFHRDLMAVLEEPAQRLVARVAPRGHAKSTCAALAYPLWCLCEQRRRNIVIVTHEAALATQFVRDIRNELESNERILEHYGDLCTPAAAAGRRGKWAESVFTTATGITVQAKGTGASFRGLRVGPHRPDLIICDDIEKDEDVASPTGRRKLDHWLRRVVLPALAPDGQLLLLGSLIHYDSLLANLRDRKRFGLWNYAVYRALEAEALPDGTFRRVALWPARWPVERLDLERERIGTLAFEQEYQANPIDDAQRIFKPEWLRRYEPSELVPDRLVTLMAVDPATGVDHGDFFALWVGSVDTATGVIYTRELSLERIGFVQQVERIIRAYLQWRPVTVGIETTAYQIALRETLVERGRKEGFYMPVTPIRSTLNKLIRIQGSSPLYENGTFRLPPVLSPEAEQQFLQLPKSEHDDAPDVCAMGIELARTLRTGTRVEGLVRPRTGTGRREEW